LNKRRTHMQRHWPAIAAFFCAVACGSKPVPDPQVQPVVLAPGCARYDEGTEGGRVNDSNLRELSGIAASRKQPAVYWVHNDSGDTARIFAIDRQGALLREVPLQGASAIDWEDIALSEMPGGAPYLLVGDIGDNDELRKSVTLYRVPEPDAKGKGAATPEAIIEVTYPDRPHNAEALMIDSVTRHAYVITKEKNGPSQVFDFGDVTGAGDKRVATLVTQMAFGDARLPGSPLVTGADMNEEFILVRTYSRLYAWPRKPNVDLATLLAQPPCPLGVAGEAQGEAVGLEADGSYVTVSEGKNPVLWRFARLPNP
jgi:hypothetical protein